MQPFSYLAGDAPAAVIDLHTQPATEYLAGGTTLIDLMKNPQTNTNTIDALAPDLTQAEQQLSAYRKALHKRIGLTFIYVTHDQEEALSMSDRVTVLDHGVKISEGRPEQVQQDEAVIQAYLGVKSVRVRRDHAPAAEA